MENESLLGEKKAGRPAVGKLIDPKLLVLVTEQQGHLHGPLELTEYFQTPAPSPLPCFIPHHRT